MVLGSPGKARANTVYHGAGTRNFGFCFPWLSAPGPQVLLVVESPASRVGGDAPWENGGEGVRGGEEARKWRHACQVWLVSRIQPRSFLLLGDFTPEVARGPWVGGHHLGGGLEKQPWTWGGAVRWRRGETGALHTAEEKRKEKAHTALFLFIFFH